MQQLSSILAYLTFALIPTITIQGMTGLQEFKISHAEAKAADQDALLRKFKPLFSKLPEELQHEILKRYPLDTITQEYLDEYVISARTMLLGSCVSNNHNYAALTLPAFKDQERHYRATMLCHMGGDMLMPFEAHLQKGPPAFTHDGNFIALVVQGAQQDTKKLSEILDGKRLMRVKDLVVKEDVVDESELGLYLELWDMSKKRPLKSIRVSEDYRYSFKKFSLDNTKFFMLRQHLDFNRFSVQCWSTKDWKLEYEQVIPSHAIDYTFNMFTSYGQLFTTLHEPSAMPDVPGAACSLGIFNPQTAAYKQLLDIKKFDLQYAALSRDERYIVGTDRYSKKYYVWELETAKLIFSGKHEQEDCASIELGADNAYVIITYRSGKIVFKRIKPLQLNPKLAPYIDWLITTQRKREFAPLRLTQEGWQLFTQLDSFSQKALVSNLHLRKPRKKNMSEHCTIL